MKLVRMSGRNTRDKSRVVVIAARELLPQMHEQTIMRLKICAYSSDDRVHFALVNSLCKSCSVELLQDDDNEYMCRSRLGAKNGLTIQC